MYYFLFTVITGTYFICNLPYIHCAATEPIALEDKLYISYIRVISLHFLGLLFLIVLLIFTLRPK